MASSSTEEFSFPMPPTTETTINITNKEQQQQRSKEELQREISALQKMLSHEEKIREILQHVHDRRNDVGSPLTLPSFLPPKAKELLTELAMVEDEISRLESQVQQYHSDLNHEKEATKRLKSRHQQQRQTSPAPTKGSGSSSSSHSMMNLTTEGRPSSSLHQLINQNTATNKTSALPSTGFETKTMHFISKAITGDCYLQDDFTGHDRIMGSPLVNYAGLDHQKGLNNHHHHHHHQRSPFRERLVKRSGVVNIKPTSSPLRDTRHPTPKPKVRTVDTSESVPPDMTRRSGSTIISTSSTQSVADKSNSTSSSSSKGHKVPPNKLSENIIKCLILIYVRLMRSSRQMELEKSGPISRSAYSSLNFRADSAGGNGNLSTSLILQRDSKQQDPYGIFDIDESVPRDIGPYKNLVVFSSSSLDPKCVSSSASIPLFQKLRGLLNSLQKADLRPLTDQQKLAFWINMYNACIMNGYLQFGVPSSPEKLLSLMNKATLNIGGNIVNAQAMEHYILRSPSPSSSVAKEEHQKGSKEAIIRELYGLETVNPNVIFALSCGTRSSPAVRIYTAEGVLSELEKSKLDYLQASVSVTSTKKIGFPELLVQNVGEFGIAVSDVGSSKEVESSLVEWVCHQLPTSGSLRKSIVDCFRGRTSNSGSISATVSKLSYEFEFQYLLTV